MSDLDDLFAQARQSSPPPSAKLAARVMADAEVTQARGRQRSAPARPGLLAFVVRIFGGAGALTGGLTAGVVGLALGYLQPDSLPGLSDLLLGAPSSEQMDLMPGIDTLFSEE
jgi:hypothetical protein